MAYFSDETLQTLKTCIQRLYDRDKRLKLYAKDFWIVDKVQGQRVGQINLDAAI